MPVDKPSGPTSHDVVDAIRHTFGLRKVGHGGTLDPQATGLLVILLGKATRLSNLFLTSDKTYEGWMHLGIATDSHDAQGKIVSEADASGVTREMVEAEMRKRTGDLLQTPPMISAVKIGGVPLYKRGRKGREVERRSRLIHVYEFTLLKFELPRVFFRLRCTKGTYVRTLCAEIGDSLGCGAHLAELRRLRCGQLDIAEAIPLEDLLRLNQAELTRMIIPMARFLPQPHLE